MDEVTRILHAIDQGQSQAAEQLLALVYDELRRLAAAKLAREKPGQTLDATALVHEAYLRLLGAQGANQSFANRGHFFAAAAEAMRRILIENARRKGREKRGGRLLRRDLNAFDLAAPEVSEDLLALDEALDQLAKVDPLAARLVQLRFFAGLSLPQVADSLDISPRTADRLWAFARAWLHDRIYGEDSWRDSTGKSA
jgi:RNA polymerase sigma factor (TIGR02999 family)